MDVAMVVIPESAAVGRAVLAKDEDNPLVKPTAFFVGEGQANYICGQCSRVLAQGLDGASQIASLVLVCPRCGSFNETRT